MNLFRDGFINLIEEFSVSRGETVQRKLKFFGLLLCMSFFGSSGFLQAAVIESTAFISGLVTDSTEALGSFDAELKYIPAAGGTSATLEVKMWNTSALDNGGYITGFVFNNPSYVTEFGPVNRIASASLLSSTNPNFILIGGPGFNDSVKAQPFGFFDAGASVTSSFQGGGSPAGGIAPAVDAFQPPDVFVFLLQGSRLDEIDIEHFTLELSKTRQNDEAGKFFVVRFRGFENGGSDKVPAGVDDVVKVFDDGSDDGGGGVGD